MTSLNVSEIFYSVQGEGPLVGTPSVFLRLTGCNLRCSWCDSKFTWNGTEKHNYQWYSIEKVQEDISNYDCKNLVITGGEPMIQQDSVYDLIGMLPDYHITIETNGTYDPHPDLFEQVHLWMVSPKKDQTISNSFGGLWDVFEGVDKVQYKFVVDEQDGIDWIIEFIEDWKLRKERIWLMPQGTNIFEIVLGLSTVINYAKKYGYRVSPRLHITAYGNKRGV